MCFFHLLIGICSGIFVRLQTIWWWMEGVGRSYGWMVAFVCPTITTDFPSHMITDWLLNLSSGNQTWQLIHSWLAIKIPPCIEMFYCHAWPEDKSLCFLSWRVQPVRSAGFDFLPLLQAATHGSVLTRKACPKASLVACLLVASIIPFKK